MVNLIKESIIIEIKKGSEIRGILLDEGKEWLLLNFMPIDFVIDGYVLVNKSYINKIKTDRSFVQKILKLKKIEANGNGILNISSNLTLFNDLADSLIAVTCKNPFSQFIGKIKIIREKSIRIKLINDECQETNLETFLLKEIRLIYLKNEYLNDLILYMNSVR